MDDQTRMKVLRNFANGAGVIAISHSLRLQAEDVETVLKSVDNRRDRAAAEARLLRLNNVVEPAASIPPDPDMILAPTVPKYETTAAGNTAPTPQIVSARPDPMSASPVSALLVEALKAGGKLATTARKVQALVDQLRNDMDEARELIEAQRRVDEAQAVLDAARSQLKALKAGESQAVVHVTRLAPGPRVLRQWAKRHGVECPAYGRVPQTVVDAWTAANGQREVA
jgi:hypothetical protein